MKLRLLALVSSALVLCACTGNKTSSESSATAAPAPAADASASAGIKPVDVPAGYGYPGDRVQFQAWADAWKIDAITATAWNLWAGMTSDSGQTWNGATLPVWETWCGNEEVFSAAGCTSLRRPARKFQRPSQIGHSARLLGAATPSDTQVVSFNKFNPPMAKYLAAQHPGPGGAQYNYTTMQSLAALNAAWPTGTPISARKVVDAPYRADQGTARGFAAMETKPVIFLVKAKGLTPMPLWMGPDQSTTPANATPETWFNCVLLDPNGAADPATAPVPATPAQIAQMVPGSSMSCKNYLYAPLATIYSFKMDADEATAWNALVNNSGDGGQNLTADAGDYGVLGGMHVNSKTTVNWTWETFWWQPGADTPNHFPGSKQGMTDKVMGAWRNYAMCSAWNQTAGNASKDMVVCFNPFLETSSGIPAGQSSNCMSCHGVATAGSPLSGSPLQLPTLNYPPDYDAPIDFNNDPRFAPYTRADFSWAIPVNAVNTASAKPSAGAAK
ncbi:hypothetical protein [Lysobacter terrae]